MYKFCVYVPKSHLEIVKYALFATGAGEYDGYTQCCWQVLGVGQFKPEKGSNPAIGHVGKLEMVDEYRIEILVREERILDVRRALHRAHPYEIPAYDFSEVCHSQDKL
ncbi:MAG: hypothetical protein Q9M28_04015 [Mariprofundaceae bacterium]|nr:hypothetical protein [Mariprofundaceae bacterium]